MLMAMLNAKSAEDQVNGNAIVYPLRNHFFSEDCVRRVPSSFYARILSIILKTDARNSPPFGTDANCIVAAKRRLSRLESA